jgi:hypothetical protein
MVEMRMMDYLKTLLDKSELKKLEKAAEDVTNSRKELEEEYTKLMAEGVDFDKPPTLRALARLLYVHDQLRSAELEFVLVAILQKLEKMST